MASDDEKDHSVPAPDGLCAGDDTTVVPPPTQAAPELAWSLDEDDDAEPVGRQSWGAVWGRAAVLLSSAAVIAFVIAVAGWPITRSEHHRQSLPPAAHPVTAATHSPVTPQVAAPRPAPVPVKAAPRNATAQTPRPPKTTTAHPAPELSAGPLAAKESESVYDQRFLDSIRFLGYVITDQQAVLRNAHDACRLFQQGESPQQVNDHIAAQTGANVADVLQLTSSAMLSYPACG